MATLLPMDITPSKYKVVADKRKLIPWQARKIVANVIDFFRNESHYGPSIPIVNFKTRAIQATGISEATYRSILREAHRIEKGELDGFRTLIKKVEVIISTDQPRILRELVYNAYIIEKKPPTVQNLMAKIQSENIPFDGSTTVLWKFMRQIGFQFWSTATNRKVIIESYKIRYKRINYLKRLLEYRKQNRPIVYITETYIDSSFIDKKPKKSSQDSDQRLFVLYAGGEMGFIPKSLSMSFVNRNNFLKWLQTQLIPNLPANSVIIIDNTTYRNIRIDQDIMYVKKDMLEWLRKRNLPCNDDMTNLELGIAIRKYRSQNATFKIDHILEQYGHNVLKLPPYHPELNPMEKIWRTLKNSLTNTGKYKMNDIKSLIRKTCKSITNNDWIQYCDDVKQMESDYLTNEEIFDEITDEFEVNLIDEDDDRRDEINEIDLDETDVKFDEMYDCSDLEDGISTKHEAEDEDETLKDDEIDQDIGNSRLIEADPWNVYIKQEAPW